MKEDKLDQEIAASLKKKLAEASVPYELGAWEGFQKKRALRKRKAIVYWASGIAASLLLIAVGINSVDLNGIEGSNSPEVQLAEKVEKTPETLVEEVNPSDSTDENSVAGTPIELDSSTFDSNEKGSVQPAQAPKPALPKTEVTPNETIPSETKNLATVPEPVEKPVKNEQPKVSSELPVFSNEKAVAQVPEKTSSQEQEQSVVTKPEEEKKQETLSPLTQSLAPETIVAVKTEEPVKPAEKEILIAESDFPVIEKEKASVGLGMGLSPGFGAVQNDNQITTASSIGLGMLVDVKLPGKLVLGSGLGFNYLNQNGKQESTVMAFGNTYPQTDKLEVQQMQVEVPVFVKYPVTRNNSISIQAGFSNLYALNGNATEESTLQVQSAFYANDALGNSSVSLRQEALVENNSLESNSGKFYPFATLNFGVNLRVLETKSANYVIMPFYNYQLKQVTGYGDTYGLFGASFKMNFGGK
ncbi:hypothetical protein SAMN04489724_4679 [Algoriphagus locisalis]|uniref:Outer membrane protein beta-barrel domain-containing protein n=1 Tax=Algoriphagus locisalis TaxID=305507 RepID=A0A1I7E113_9BACT|nr:hypothetical protein [Algoriphagus locisalis]SFU17619.1 hypothetical protein SAMN04489724_4679 [Algoriphagus locisalis]